MLFIIVVEWILIHSTLHITSYNFNISILSGVVRLKPVICSRTTSITDLVEICDCICSVAILIELCRSDIPMTVLAQICDWSNAIADFN